MRQTISRQSATFVCMMLPLSLLLLPVFAGDIYIHENQDGTISFTDSPKDSRFTVFLREKPLPEPKAVSQTAFPLLNTFDELLHEKARLHGVPVELLKAVCVAESGMNPNAVSRAGAQGLMQLMPPTGETWASRIPSIRSKR